MDRTQVRNLVVQQFNNSLAESGVQITAIPQPQLRAVVDALADSMFALFDALEDEAATLGTPGTTAPTPANTENTEDSSNTADATGETLLWRGRPYLTIGTRYELTTQRLRIFRGILGNQLEEIELIRVKDTRVKQHVGERILNVGDISVISADSTTPELTLNNVREPVEVRELIRQAVMKEKARRGIRYREDIGDEGTH